LIAEVTAEIVRFQTVNHRPVVDGVIDPAGGTLKVMNQLAADPSPGTLAAKVMPAPDGLPEAAGAQGVYVVDPTPIQGGYVDGNYDSFTGWGGLWRDYTSVIGGQVAASGADQVLVIPFYRTSQMDNLGDFLTNWREVVSAVVTAAMNSVDAFFLRDKFTFDRIVSSSFSNGWRAHHKFHTLAAGAANMTDVLYDLDGVAGGSTWQPSKGVIYQNRKAPGKTNPVGNNWYVGSRWDDFKSIYGGSVNGHAASRNHLLYHGLLLRRT
jgi:hypothetical protein